MTTNALRDIAKIEANLWEAADQLRANCKLTRSEYCTPVFGGDLLRHGPRDLLLPRLMSGEPAV